MSHMSYHIISYRIVSYRIISYHILSYRIVSYHILSYLIISSFQIIRKDLVILSGYAGRLRENRNGIKLHFSLRCTVSVSVTSHRVPQIHRLIFDVLRCLKSTKYCFALSYEKLVTKQTVNLRTEFMFRQAR
jgi:hypothetical protein